MTDGATIRVPAMRPPGWAPSWDEKYAGLTVARRIEYGDWLAATGGRTLVGAQIVVGAPLLASPPLVGDTWVTVYLSGGDAVAGRSPVGIAVQLSDGDRDEIEAWQPVRPDPVGLAPVGSGAFTPGFVIRGAWAPSTPYAPADLLTHGGSTWCVRVGFTSGVAFDPTNLDLWAAAGVAGPAGPAGGAGPQGPPGVGAAIATAATPGSVRPGAALAVQGDGTLDVVFGAGHAVSFDDPRITMAEPLGLGDLRRYGWVGDGRDDTAAFQAAMAGLPAVGGKIVIPASAAGTTLGALLIDKGVTIRGDGGQAGQTQLRPLSPTQTMFTVTAGFVTFEDLAIGPTYPTFFKQTAGSYIRVEASAGRFRAQRLTLTEFHEGITIAGSVPTVDLTDIRAFLYSTGLSRSTAALRIQGGLDMRVDGVTFNGPGTGSADVLTGVWVENVGDCVITNADIIAMGTDLLVAPGSGQGVTSLWVMDSFLDTAVRGAVWAPSGTGAIARCRMSNVWASSHAEAGIEVSGAVDGLDIEAPHLLLNGTHGLALLGGSNIRVRGGQAAQNGDNGVYVAAGVSDWTVDGATLGATGGLAGNTSYGIYVAPGASDRYRITGNATAGNGAAGVQDGGTGTHKTVWGNLGDEDGYTAFRDATTGYLVFSGRQAGFSGYIFRTNDGTEHFRADASGARVDGNLVVHAGNIDAALGTWFAALPTTLPAAGQFWNDGGTLARA